jgi:hypothetical protein
LFPWYTFHDSIPLAPEGSAWYFFVVAFVSEIFFVAFPHFRGLRVRNLLRGLPAFSWPSCKKKGHHPLLGDGPVTSSVRLPGYITPMTSACECRR